MPRRSWERQRRPAAPSPHPDRATGTPDRDNRRSAGNSPRKSPEERVILYGWHAVKAALENPQRRIRTLLLTENAARRLAAEGPSTPVQAEIVRSDVLAARLPPDAVHQGVLAEADPLPPLDLDDLPTDGITLLLDQVTDPHNVGAILRSAAAFAARAAVTTIRHSPQASGVLAKSASGALELVPIIAVPNLARALAGMKARGFFLVGLDSASAIDLSLAPLRLPLGLVVGGEGRGLRQLTRNSCDLVARLTLPGPIKSLNVSNATALALYVASTRLGLNRASNQAAPVS
jgi:23S rRNA (guanosine2251-2'-O)-methyltransferase